MTAAASPLLETRALSKRFGAFEACRQVDLRLQRGARHALIGPNGAGKTTLVNLISGVLAPSEGTVLLEGADVTRLDQSRRVKQGLARTFQINQLFRGLSAIENVALAVAEQRGAGWQPFRPLGRRGDILDEAARQLDRLGLIGDATRLVRELPYGRQRLLEVAIALSLQPRVLLLDEPAAGVPSTETHVILDALEALDPDIALLIIKHDMDVVFRLARRVTVLVRGAVLTEGSPEEIGADLRVREVYLGHGDGAGRHG
jgi:ABC-type branched-subunit amino acid transport system ATPase component